MEEKEKYIITVDGIDYKIDHLGYEYSQQDGDGSGRNDDYSMTRDVVGLLNKLYCDIEDIDYWRNENIPKLLKLIDKTSCSCNYFDLKKYQRVTKEMYIVSDPIKMDLIENDVIIKPFQIRFIQMDVDEI